MALVVNDRVKETSTTTGTVTFNLDGAVTGFETFSSAIGNGNTTYYAIEIPNTTEFEVGLGTIAAGTLARTTVISSSNSDALVNFSAGTKNVFCTLPASKAVIEDASNNVTLPADLTVDTNTLHVDSSNNRVGIGTTSPARDLQIAKSTSGGTVRLEVNNESNTGASNGVISIYSGGTSGGDPYLHFKVDNGEQYSIGIDNDQSDALVFSNSFGVGSNNLLSIATDGATTFTDKIILGANKSIEFGDSGETITGDGTAITVASSEDITLDAASEINLDAGSDSIRIKDDGTEYGRIHRVSGGGLIIKSQESDKDIQFQGVDGGSSVTALTLDMSDEGFAEFNSKIRVEADSSANAILVKGRSADDIGTIKFTANDGSGNQGELSARSSVFIFNTPTQTNFRINNTDKLTLTSSQINLKDNVFVDVNEQIQFGDAGETISGDGTDLTIASSNKIILNADGAGQVFFKDGGTNLAKLFVSSQVFTLETIVSDGDFAIKGNDNGSSVTALTLDMSEAGAATFNDKIILGANKAIEFGDAGESISGDGTDMTITGNIVKIDAANRIILDAAENRIDLHDNGSEFARFVNNGGQLRILTGSSAATAVSFDSSGAATFNDKVILGANKVIEFGDAGETISGDGTNLTIASSGFFLLDVTGNILLDSANNGFIALRDNGTSYINFSENSGNAILNTPINDGDFFIKGNDGGSEITALTLDMSEAGAATFNSDVTVGSKLKLPTNTANKILVADGTSFEEVDISGDATIASGGTLTLANSGVSAASYTNSSITVDAKGRVTAASSGAAGVSAGFVTAMAIAL